VEIAAHLIFIINYVMEYLIFATNNQHKAEEVRSVLPKNFDIKTLKEAGINIEIAEPHDTLEENATEKSSVIYTLTKSNCFSEDTGLEVEALNGQPGVKSARYADDGLFKDKIDKLLYNLDKIEKRNAQFRTIISLMFKGTEYRFEGVCKGTIIANRRGTNGFGYDPVFMPEGCNKTFGEMEIEEKNAYSHRRKAVDKLVEFLEMQSKII
jgi:XTP/dITP diphosphohydrolase